MRTTLLRVGLGVLCLLLCVLALKPDGTLKPVHAIMPHENPLQVHYNPADKPSQSESVHIVETPNGFTIAGLPQTTSTRPGWKLPAKPVIPTFPKSFADAVRVRSGVADVACRPIGGHPESLGTIAADGSLVYENAFDGCDVQYRSSALKTEEFIVVKNEKSQVTWSWDLDLGNADLALTPRITSIQSIELLDSHGVPRLRIDPPAGRDARGALLLAGDRLKLTLDRSCLTITANTTGLEFPLEIDPSWSSTGAMSVARTAHASVLLNNGKVLVAGGNDGNSVALSSYELFDPTTSTWTANLMLSSHLSPIAISLNDGTVLVFGDRNSTSSETYDPIADSWTATGPTNVARQNSAAALLSNGQVFVTGGSQGLGATSSTEIYDPTSRTWSTSTPMNDALAGHSETLLNDGTVLVAGGVNGLGASSNSEVFDPVNKTWSSDIGMAQVDEYNQATLLFDGTVLVTGGYPTNIPYLGDIFSPVTHLWKTTSSQMHISRASHIARILLTGEVLIAGGLQGGINPGVTIASAELYDPSQQIFTALSPMSVERSGHAASRLANGYVLITGGSSNSVTALASCEIFDPRPVGIAQNVSVALGSNTPITLGSQSLSQPVTYKITQQPVHGSLSGSGASQVYTANTGFTGTDNFVYTVDDGFNPASDPTTISITVTDTAPTALPQTVSTHLGSSLSLTLTGTHPTNLPLTFPIVQSPLHGTLTALTTNGNYSYAPTSSFVGSDSFTFKANDGVLDSNVATVSINVTDSAPVATSQSVSTHFNVPVSIVLVATDLDNDPLSYTLTQPAHGTLSGTAPNLTYTPNNIYVGSDSFTFKVNDGALNSNVATVTINVTNHSPIITAAGSPTVILEGQTVSFLSTASDPDNDPLSYLWDFNDGSTSTQANPTHTYTTAGTYTATLTVSDAAGATATATVTINVFHDSDRPTARFVSSDLNGFVGVPLGFDATFSTDPLNNIVSYTWDFGDGSPSGAGQLISRVYSATGTYTITLTVVDGRGLSDTTTLTMVVLPADQAGALNPNIKYSVSWNRSATNSDALSMTATVNVGTTPVTSSSPLTLRIVGQTFAGTSTKKATISGPKVKWLITPNNKKGVPAGTYSLKCTVTHANLANAFALAGVSGTKTSAARIPIRIGIGGSSFESSINSQFRFGSNGARASGGGQGPK